jgi:hypothetical protein
VNEELLMLLAGVQLSDAKILPLFVSLIRVKKSLLLPIPWFIDNCSKVKPPDNPIKS